jgi:hypothetical protein
LRIIEKDRLGPEIGLTDDSGTIRLGSAADLLRRIVHTWRLADRREVLRLIRKHLTAVGITDPSISRALLDRLVRVGDLAAVQVGPHEFITPGEPRWIQSGSSLGTLLGLPAVPEGIERLDTTSGDVLHRVRLDSEGVEILTALQVREITVREFMLTPPYLEYLHRRGLEASTDVGLADYWWRVHGYANETALLTSSEADIRVVTGDPGGFFGSHQAEELEGRWTDQLRPGSWLGYRRGYNDEHWHPALIICGVDSVKVLDLIDHDELRWLLLARGTAEGQREIVHRSDGLVSMTFPLPSALHSALEVLGPNVGPWKWEIGGGVEIPFSGAFDVQESD